MLRGVAPLKAAQRLAASAVAVSHTGNTDETALATVAIPASAMGLSGGIQIRSVWSTTNSANNKTLRVRLGGIAGTAFFAGVITTSATVSDVRVIRNRGAANSQVGSMSAASVGGTSTSGGAVVTGSIDTSAAVDLVISAQLANSGETVTLEMYEVWLLP